MIDIEDHGGGGDDRSELLVMVVVVVKTMPLVVMKDRCLTVRVVMMM